MLYSFKQKSQDFIVEEQLPFKLDGKGDAFFVYFEKRNLNTMDVIKHLCKELEISRLTLGIAGLKDKDAITRQWISIYKSALKKMGGEKEFLNALNKVARVITTDWHSKPIGMTNHVENTFHIRLRAQQAISQDIQEKMQTEITKLLEVGFPNFFGEQRFGINKQNIQQGREILMGTLRLKEKFETNFKLQAYSSFLFNEYLKARMDKKWSLLDGDILTSKGDLYWYDQKSKTANLIHKENSDSIATYHPGETIKQVPYDYKTMMTTGPIFGYNLMLSPEGTQSGQLDEQFIKKYRINQKFFDRYKHQRIWGLRRPLRVFPADINFRFQGDDILLSFNLPGGTYASVLIDEILKIVKE